MSWAAGRFSAEDHPDGVVLEADVIVIGSGAGGSAVALSLAEAGHRVAVLEAGRHWNPADFKPSTAFAFRHLYQANGARSARGNTVMPLPGGRGVGGSTLINSAICFRTPRPVLEDWRDRCGIDTIDPEAFGPIFDRLWTSLGVTVQSLEVQRLNNIVFRDGAEKLGLKGEFMERSAPGCVGCGICQYGCPTGGKSSVDRTLLVEGLATGNLEVHAGFSVESVVERSGRIEAVTGVLLSRETGKPIGTFTAKGRAFVLSGGPIGSPLFLLRNGLGNEHTGQHLTVHPTVPGLASFPFEIKAWSGVTQGCYVDCWDEGFLLQTYTTTPDQTYAVLPTAIGEASTKYMARLAHIGSAGTLVHDEDSHGHVQSSPVGPDIYYHLGEGDKQRLIRGLRRIGEIYFAAGAEVYLPARVGGGEVRTMRDLERVLPLDLAPQYLQTYASHPMGTCRMSARPEDGVVDPLGRVWGLENFHVADASVFPTSLGVNPQITVMAMAMQIGTNLAGRLSST